MNYFNAKFRIELACHNRNKGACVQVIHLKKVIHLHELSSSQNNNQTSLSYVLKTPFNNVVFKTCGKLVL